MNTILLLLNIFSLFTFIFSEPNPNFHIYLAFGQSNMNGVGQMTEEDLKVPERFVTLAATDFPNMGRELGKWYPATPPICRENSGLGPCDYFGRTLVENLPKEIKIGIINVAIFGVGIELFDEDKCEEYISANPWIEQYTNFYGNNPYKRLIDMGKKAQEDGVIKGILLHQGENNSGDVNWPNSVKKIYYRILEELNLKEDEVPLLIGELLSEEAGGCCYAHNAIIGTLPDIISNAHVIKSNGLKGTDNAHFSAEGYREFGKRYAETMLKLLK